MTIDTIGVGSAPGDNTGDGLRTAMTKVNNNFGSSANAASKLVGTDPDEVPLNSDLGTASVKNTGTASGEIPTADDLGMVGGQSNFTSANYQPNSVQGLNDPHELYYSAALALNSGDTVGGPDLNVFTRDINGVASIGGSPGGSYTYTGSVPLTQNRIGRFNRFV